MTDRVNLNTPYALVDRALTVTADLRQATIARRLCGAADALQKKGDILAALVVQHFAETLAREVGVEEALSAGGRPLALPPPSMLMRSSEARTAATELARAVRAAMEEMVPKSTFVPDAVAASMTERFGAVGPDGFQYCAGDGWIGYVTPIGDTVFEGRCSEDADVRSPLPTGKTAVEIAARLLVAADHGRAALAAFTHAPQMLSTLYSFDPPVDVERLPPDERVAWTAESRSTGWCILAVDAALRVVQEAKLSYSHLVPALALVAGGRVLKSSCVIDGRRTWDVTITIPRRVSPSFLARWLHVTQPWVQAYTGPEQVTTIDAGGVPHTFAFGWH